MNEGLSPLEGKESDWHLIEGTFSQEHKTEICVFHESLVPSVALVC